MKIGIVSLYGWLRIWDNYGTLLQNFALQAYLAKQGHESYWIRTRPSPAPQQAEPLVHRLLAFARAGAAWLLKPLRGASRSERLAEFNRRNPRRFGEFLERFVPHTEREYTQQELLVDPPEADVYICGSDQVWRDVTAVNFLGFGRPEVRRIAYAVSAPWPALSDQWYARAGAYVADFSAIGVREREGLAVCERLGRADAVQTLDPTLLLEREDYLDVVRRDIGDVPAATPEAIAYFVNVRALDQIPWNAVRGFASDSGIGLRVIPLQGTELVMPPESLMVPTPSGWLGAFASASCILTNSYHGSLFGVIMRRPFLVFLQTGSTEAENCRFTSALDPLGLGDRVLAPAEWQSITAADLRRRMDAPIDWTAVGQRLDALRRSSEAYLLRALSAPAAR